MRNLSPDDVAAIRSFSIDEFMGDEFVENYWIRFGLAEAFLSNPSFDTPEPSKTDQVSGRGKKWASVNPKNNSPLPPHKIRSRREDSTFDGAETKRQRIAKRPGEMLRRP